MVEVVELVSVPFPSPAPLLLNYGRQRQINRHPVHHASFPLTPSLSLGERAFGIQSVRTDRADAPDQGDPSTGCRAACNSPSPWGRGPG